VRLKFWGNDERRSSSLAYPSEELVSAFGVSASYSGQNVTVKKALGLAAVFSAVEKISEAVGTLPLKVYRIMDDDERVEARAHRTWRMLHDQPNEYTTAHRFWSTCAAQGLLHGNVYLLKQRSLLGELEQLWLIDPSQVELLWDPQNMRKSFKVSYSDGRYRTLSDEEVLHIPFFSLDGIYGCSRIAYARQTLGTTLARAEFEGGFYRRGARLSGVIQYPGRLGENGLKNLSEAFSRWHSGSENMHRVPVLEDGATFNSVSMPLEDMQFLQQSQLSLTEIAVLFNLPPAYLGGSTGDSLTYATTESNQIQFAQMAIAPLTNTIAKALSADPAILPQNVFYCEFMLEGLLRADMKTRAEYWEKLLNLGVVTPAYVAARENLPEPPEPKEEPAAEAPTGEAGNEVPPEMQQMQAALKSVATNAA